MFPPSSSTSTATPPSTARTRGSVNLVGLGLAFFDVVFMYNAYKAI